MDPNIKSLCGAATTVVFALVIATLSSCGPRPIAQVTGLSLKNGDNSPASFHGYFATDGITNQVHGSMPTNFVFATRRLVFEFVRDQGSPQGFEVTVLTSDRMNRTAHGQDGIRGHLYFYKDGSDEWLSQPFAAMR